MALELQLTKETITQDDRYNPLTIHEIKTTTKINNNREVSQIYNVENRELTNISAMKFQTQKSDRCYTRNQQRCSRESKSFFNNQGMLRLSHQGGITNVEYKYDEVSVSNVNLVLFLKPTKLQYGEITSVNNGPSTGSGTFYNFVYTYDEVSVSIVNQVQLLKPTKLPIGRIKTITNTLREPQGSEKSEYFYDLMGRIGKVDLDGLNPLKKHNGNGFGPNYYDGKGLKTPSAMMDTVMEVTVDTSPYWGPALSSVFTFVLGGAIGGITGFLFQSGGTNACFGIDVPQHYSISQMMAKL